MTNSERQVVKRYLINRVREDDGLIGVFALYETSEKFVHIDVKFVLATDDALLSQVERMREAAEFAREVLSTLYAKYGAAIGPYSSQAQKANVLLGAALKGESS